MVTVRNRRAGYHDKVITTPQTDQSHETPVLHTDQHAVHGQLERIVQHHQQHPWRKPCPGHTRKAFSRLQEMLAIAPRPVILDSFCGTGMSTAILAAQFPEALVVGIDQSAHRLEKHQASGDKNYVLLQAEAEPFWCCLADAGATLEAHYLLYPNPWPKAAQIKRRVHGHGAFPVLAGLGGRLEMRTNWAIFAREFARAATLIGCEGAITRLSMDAPPLTLFERKYGLRGHPLWQFRGKFSN